jgi:uncharacterized repeat protein (TIGR03803 family)
MKNYRLIAIAFALLLSTIIVNAQAQTYNVLYNFGGRSGDPTGPHYSGIIAQGHDGNLYSAADNHWTDELGAAFRITRGGAVTVLHHFSGSDGQGPTGGLTLATDGEFYGTTQSGGRHSQGTIFRITAGGALTTLYSFVGRIDGSNPQAPPIQGFNGSFYGTTFGGTASGDYGSVYKITSSGAFTTLHNFGSTDGANPYAPLLQGNDGNFYGTTSTGGTHNAGTIFRIKPTGKFTVLFNFDGAHGANPYAPLIQGSDGNFYGVASAGGSAGGGVAFKITPSGLLTVLHQFTGGSDGSNQVGGLVQATDGNFYGTNNVGGAFDWGVLFRITPTGLFTVLHDFDWESGASPQSTLCQHTRGVLYGSTAVGGIDNRGEGTFYRFDVGLGPFVSFVAGAGKVRDTVEILGQGFLRTTEVSFNGTPALFTVISDTYMTASVPHKAKTGFVTVTTRNGKLRSNKEFRVLPASLHDRQGQGRF